MLPVSYIARQLTKRSVRALFVACVFGSVLKIVLELQRFSATPTELTERPRTRIAGETHKLSRMEQLDSLSRSRSNSSCPTNVRWSNRHIFNLVDCNQKWDVPPITLSHCEQLQTVPRATVVPRDDLFAAGIKSFTYEPGMGLMTFHFRKLPEGEHDFDIRLLFAELDFKVNHNPFGHGLARKLAQSLNCSCPNDMVYTCRCAPPTSSTNGATQDPVTLKNVYPNMFSWPSSSDDFGMSKPNANEPTMDRTMPSVAVFNDAYVEVNTGRIKLISCTETREQYLVQFNDCGSISHAQYTSPRYATWSVARYDRIVVISALWSHAYYHATIEHFPRLWLIRDFLHTYPDVLVVITASDTTSTMHLYASLLGIEESRIVTVLYGKDTIIYANTIYIPEPTQCGHLMPRMAQGTRSIVRQIVEDHRTLKKDSSVDDWIVVVRRLHGRSIQKHEDMMARLQTAFPSEKWMVFDESNLPPLGIPQWDFFAHAKLVIAPHGAGLSNLLACRQGVSVIEFLASGDGFSPCYLSLSLALNLDYHPLFMTPVNEGVYEEIDGLLYSVDVDHVVTMVSFILQHPQL